jgi:hypothetical protein
MIQVSLVAYVTAGAFLGLAYFDYYYTLVAVVVLCKSWLLSHAASRTEAPAMAEEGVPLQSLYPGGRRPSDLAAPRQLRGPSEERG